MIDPLVATWCLTAPDQIAAPGPVLNGATAVREAPSPLTAPFPRPSILPCDGLELNPGVHGGVGAF